MKARDIWRVALVIARFFGQLVSVDPVYAWVVMPRIVAIPRNRRAT